MTVVVSVVVVGTTVVTTSVIVVTCWHEPVNILVTVCGQLNVASTPLIPKFWKTAASITNIVKEPDFDAPFWRPFPRPSKCIEKLPSDDHFCLKTLRCGKMVVILAPTGTFFVEIKPVDPIQTVPG